MGTYLARPRATRRRPRPSAEPVCPRPPGRPGADRRRLPVTPEPRQSSAGQRKLQPPARAPAPLAEAAVRSREAPPRQTGLWCEPSCRGLSPAGPLHPPGPPRLGEQHGAGRAGCAGGHALHAEPRLGHLPKPNRSLGGGETPAPGEGPHSLRLDPPRPSLPLPAHQGFLCWGPHGRRGEENTIRIWGCSPPSAVCAPALRTPPPCLCATWIPTEQHHQGVHIRPRRLGGASRQRHPHMPGPRCPEDH